MSVLESGENYLETILILKKRMGTVRSIDIVHELNFTKPSVSIALKKLREDGYVEVDNHGYITLTESGKEIAESVYERHLILSYALEKLGVEKEVAVKDACKIEHHISEETFQAIKKHMKDMPS